MLVVADNLSTFTLGAGEPFLLQVEFQDRNGALIDFGARAFALSFYEAGGRAVQQQIAGVVDSDGRGKFLRFEQEGTWSESLYGGTGLKVELAERYLRGRNVIATGMLTIGATAAVVPSLSTSAIGAYATRIVVKDAATTGGLPVFSQSRVPWAAKAANTPPAPVFTTVPSISPASGTAGATTFTASDGAASNASGYTRRWLLDGTAIGTGATVTPSAAGSLVLEVTAHGPGGDSQPASSATVAVAAAQSTPTLPSGLVFRLRPGDTTANPGFTTNGAGVTQIVDSVGGVVFTATGGSPKFRTAASTGSSTGAAGIDFDGNSYFTCAVSAQGALKTALDSQEYTIVAVVENAANAGNLGVLFGVGANGNIHLMADGANTGFFTSSGGALPETTAGYQSFGCTSSTASNRLTSGISGLSRHYNRGLPFRSANAALPGTANQVLGLGTAGLAPGNLNFKGRLIDLLVFNRELGTDDMMRVEAVLNAAYKQTHPAVTKGKLLAIDGDSRRDGVGAEAGPSGEVSPYFQYKVAAGLGYGNGTWACYAIGASTIQDCLARAPVEIDKLASQFPSGVAFRAVYEEFFNSRALAVGTPSTAGTLAGLTAQWFGGRRAALGAAAKLIGMSPIDHADSQGAPGSGREASRWGNYLSPVGKGGAGQGQWAALGMDALADVWGTTALGGDAACPNTDPFAPWLEGVHLLAAGQTTEANAVIAAAQSIIGFS